MQRVFEICLEEGQPELRRVPSRHDVDAVRHDGQRHEEGVDGDGQAAVAHIVVPEARRPAATQILSPVHHDGRRNEVSKCFSRFDLIGDLKLFCCRILL